MEVLITVCVGVVGFFLAWFIQGERHKAKVRLMLKNTKPKMRSKRKKRR